MNSRKLFFLSFLIIISTACVGEIFAWDDKLTHKDLSKYAAVNSILELSRGDYLKNLGFSAGLSEKFLWNDETQSVLLWLQKGAELEDEGSNWQGFTGAARRGRDMEIQGFLK